jgi:hypothetical protein
MRMMTYEDFKQHSQYAPMLESEKVAPLNCDSDSVLFRPALYDDYT